MIKGGRGCCTSRQNPPNSLGLPQERGRSEIERWCEPPPQRGEQALLF
jgi:hypothetical protein